MNWLRLVIALALFGAGAGAGVFTYRGTVVEACASDLSKLETGRCPKAIQNGFDSAKLKAAEKTIEYRDKTVTVLARDNQQDTRRAEELQARITELTKVERTNACAGSPAFRLRRQQLCAAYGGTDCGTADQDPG